MRIFVFSYNRGCYLRNCLGSILRHASRFPVTVMDDGSTEVAVHEALDEVRDRIEVVEGHADSVYTDQYLGGLYGNMQRAVERFPDEDLALFIQDDQQLVRDLEPVDEAHWARIFEQLPATFQIATTFLKPTDALREPGRLWVDRDKGIYVRNPAFGRRAYFSAVGLFNLNRMREMDWHFALTEGENNLQAKELGHQMCLSAYPFMMWLPNAESSKFGRKGLLHRFAEWCRGSGFYPYEPMSSEESASLLARDPEAFPIAQEWLRPTGLSDGAEWSFADATKSIPLIHRHMKRKKKRRAEAATRRRD